jgi:hypothetical protein
MTPVYTQALKELNRVHAFALSVKDGCNSLCAGNVGRRRNPLVVYFVSAQLSLGMEQRSWALYGQRYQEGLSQDGSGSSIEDHRALCR